MILWFRYLLCQKSKKKSRYKECQHVTVSLNFINSSRDVPSLKSQFPLDTEKAKSVSNLTEHVHSDDI